MVLVGEGWAVLLALLQPPTGVMHCMQDGIEAPAACMHVSHMCAWQHMHSMIGAGGMCLHMCMLHMHRPAQPVTFEHGCGRGCCPWPELSPIVGYTIAVVPICSSHCQQARGSDLGVHY